MKKLKKGFTLIELLGVLLLLAIIALITFPIIDKTLTSAKEEAYNRQKDNIIEAARMYVTENGNYNTNQKQLSFQTLIDAGFLKDGDILDPRDSSKNMPGCIIYNWSESKNQYIYEYSEECSSPTYAVGDLLKVQVSDSETQNIYVLEVNGDEIVGILDRNLPGGTVAWISEEDLATLEPPFGNNPTAEEVYNYIKELGPITANKVLNEKANTWNKVTKKYLPEATTLLKLTQFYQNLSESDKQNWESKYFEKLEASFEVDCNSVAECREKFTEAGYGDILLPEWATINLETTGDSSAGYGYWTSTPVNYSVVSGPDFAWFVYAGGRVLDGYVVDPASVGVRPVIHISQSNILSKLEAPEYVNPDDVGGEIDGTPK